MSNNNPFTPPQANVADIRSGDDNAVQEPSVFTTKGRVGRLRYLGWSMVASLIMILVVGIAAAVVFGTGASPALFFGVYALSVIPALVFSVMVLIQRSHDMDWSGWTVLIALFVPLAILVWMFKAGTPGSNRYGPKPTPNSTGVKVAAFGFPVLLIGLGIFGGVVGSKLAPPMGAGDNPYADLAEPAAEPAAEPVADMQGSDAQTERPAEQPAAEQPAGEQPAAEQPATQPGTSGGTSTQ